MLPYTDARDQDAGAWTSQVSHSLRSPWTSRLVLFMPRPETYLDPAEIQPNSVTFVQIVGTFQNHQYAFSSSSRTKKEVRDECMGTNLGSVHCPLSSKRGGRYFPRSMRDRSAWRREQDGDSEHPRCLSAYVGAVGRSRYLLDAALTVADEETIRRMQRRRIKLGSRRKAT